MYRVQFEKVLNGMIEYRSWEEVRDKYSEFIPELVSMMDYIVRMTFKVLFRDMVPKYYELYHRRQGGKACFTYAVVEAIAASRNNSCEKRTAQAILYTTFGKKDVDDIIEEIQLMVSKIE